MKCYLCGCEGASKPLALKSTFTGHNTAKSPESHQWCKRCEWSVNLRAKYFNPEKKKDSILSGRNWSWLLQGNKIVKPVIHSENNNEGNNLEKEFPRVSGLPTRIDIREWILNPPLPPFTIAIAESGQKHILYLAQEAYSQELFPVQFELTTVYVNRNEITELVETCESLMRLGATKTEISTGEYKSQFLAKNLIKYESLENKVKGYRGSTLLTLALYISVNL